VEGGGGWWKKHHPPRFRNAKSKLPFFFRIIFTKLKFFSAFSNPFLSPNIFF